MKMDEHTAKAVAEMEAERNVSGLISFFCLLAACLITTASVHIYSVENLDQYAEYALVLISLVGVGFCAYKLCLNGWLYKKVSGVLSAFRSGHQRLSVLEVSGTAAALSSAIKNIKAEKNALLAGLLSHQEEYLEQVVDSRMRKELSDQLKKEMKQCEQEYLQNSTDFRNRHPLYKAYYALDSAESYLKGRRKEIEAEWNKVYEGFSWWNKLKYASHLNFQELDKKISDLDFAKRRLLKKHEDSFNELNSYYGTQAKQAFERMVETKIRTEEYIQQCKYEDCIGDDLLKKGFFLASMSVPVSMWSDVSQAGEIYDVLRSVNANYAAMSDSEIWWESLFLQSESLAGLVSLTKGAYLEQLVANDTGGQLFEHFNNPDTDIMIDGVAFQIKATDSTGYIESVADGVPVIATTEVANLTDAIDSGYSNEELHEAVSLAVGGTVIDVGDTAVDAILTGVGGLGFLATLEGISHAVEKHENGGDPVEAAFEGAGVAIEGTARAAVNTLEMGYNILNSRPSRFVGRGVLKALTALDKKLMGTEGSGKGK